jgi:hypothetical protein
LAWTFRQATVRSPEAERHYTSGLSLQKIATRLGWEDTTIYNQLKMGGVQMRGPHQ